MTGTQEKVIPKIIGDIVEFFQYWDNPDEEKGEYKSIKAFQLAIYGPSMNFIFKWIISEEEMKQASEYTGFEIVDNTLTLSLATYNIELSIIEEVEHIDSGKEDETRAFQNHLISQWLKTMENSNGLFL